MMYNNEDRFFESRPSKCVTGELGLFSKCKIRKNTIFKVNIKKTSAVSLEEDAKTCTYKLDFFVPLYDYLDMSSLCLMDTTLVTYNDIIQHLDPSVFHQKYVLSDSLFMRANDLGFAPNINSEVEYEPQKNKIDLIMRFNSDGKAEGICAVVLDDIWPKEEVGITYGWNFWQS